MKRYIQPDIEDYLKQIKQGLKLEPRKQKKVIKDLRRDIYTYLSENPDTTIVDILSKFGDIDDVIEANSTDISEEIAKKSIYLPKQLSVIIIASLAVIALCIIVYLVFAFIDGKVINRPLVVYEVKEEAQTIQSAIQFLKGIYCYG